MTFDDVDHAAILAVLPALGHAFRTKTLSEHPTMIAAHATAGDANYHTIIGRYLSNRVPEVALIEPLGGLGAQWKNSICDSAPTPLRDAESVAPPAAARAHAGLGPQSGSDNTLARRMRRHQSW